MPVTSRPAMLSNTYTGYALNDPDTTRNSPTKPFSPGRPSEAMLTKMSAAPYTGTSGHSPPKRRKSRVCAL